MKSTGACKFPERIKLPEMIKIVANKNRNNSTVAPKRFTLGADEAKKNLENDFFAVFFCLELSAA